MTVNPDRPPRAHQREVRVPPVPRLDDTPPRGGTGGGGRSDDTPDRITPADYMSDPNTKRLADDIMKRANLNANDVAEITHGGDAWLCRVYRRWGDGSLMFTSGEIAAHIVKVEL